jgi:hyperosmotically inducible protein
MKRNRLSAFIAVAVLATFAVGCGERAETNANASVAVNGNSNMSQTSASAPGNPNAPTATVNAGAPTDATAKNARRNAPAAKDLAPQIGSGGNDLYLFTQTRAVLNADDELKAAAVNVSINGGVVTLAGKVASEAQKAKAEQLVRSVEGVKDVKNQLSTSASGARR